MVAGKQDRVAKRYARALFEVCPPAEFDATAKQLRMLSSAWTSSADFRQAMLNPSIQDGARLSIVESLVTNLGPSIGLSGWVNQPIQRTVQALVALRKVAIVPMIAEIFVQLVNEYRKSLTLAVSVAKEVTPELVADVKAKLSQTLGGEVTVTVKTDAALLGGMTIRLGDTLLDRSVAGTLQRLASQLA
ncbi:MAG: ATP synthase F1 subunit delta [Pseudomonadota bacterium]|jgi:F-type H+-transporting ATPase subunit delta